MPTPNYDSASQSYNVTVRQVFPDGPAAEQQASFRASAVTPFPFGSCLALLNGTDEHRASIKRFNFVT